MACLLELGIDHFCEIFEGFGASQKATVHKEAGCAPDSRLGSLLLVIVDHCFETLIQNVLLKSRRVETDVFCVLLQVCQLELLCVFKELVVVLPEFPLSVCNDRGRVRQRSIFVERQRKMLPYDTDLVAISAANLVEGRTDP